MLSYYLRCYGRFSFLEDRDEHFRGKGYNIGKRQASSSRQKGTVWSPDLEIYIRNLPFSVKSDHLRVWFEEYGTVHKAKVMEDDYTGKSLGYGFITMSSTDEVKAAVDRFNGSLIGGRKLTVRSGPPPPKESPYRCFVANLPFGVSPSELADHFDQDGDVLDAKVVYDETGVSKGFGFVIYGSAEEVQNAVECFNGTLLWDRTLRVEVAEARQGP
ncbi:hypothetical protein MKW94_030171 [Papaver nudicaule]|uniref:RRM domain-containing protein n=1 Tax=Papaver nudicaule TaxID=74823 RepID=A0AA41V879_PAPNU|nr:hypothetical protein [Papaver nudicaule]